MKTVAAVVRTKDAPFLLEEVDLDAPRANEVLVRMVATGVCHTDLSVRSGAIPFPLPAVLGHEGAGVVEAIGEAVQRVKPGDRVLASFSSCGACSSCQAGHPAYCTYFLPLNLLGGARLDGSSTINDHGQPPHAHFFGQSSFARHALVDERNLVKVTTDVPLKILAPLGCGLQTGAGAVLNVLHPEPGSALAVFGIGSVGLAAIMGARLSGAGRIVAVDRVPSRLELARELGATDIIDTRSANVLETIMNLTSRSGVNYAIEATGNMAVLRQAIESLAPLGTCALIGAPLAGSTVPVDVNFMLNGRRIVGITEGDSDPQRFIPALIRLYEQGRFPLDRLIRHYPFEQIEKAAADAMAGITIKSVLTYD